ncbi:MAG: tetratricopeptide repeat protein [Methylococcales bacterium]
MLIFRVLSILSLFLLNGCADVPEKSGSAEKSASPVKTVEKREKKPVKAYKNNIDPDVLYMLLTAELAGQREQYGIALEGYMEAAKRAKDPKYAERAARIAMYMKDGTKTDEAVALWLGQDPNNPTAIKIAILSAIRNGDKKAITAHLHDLLKVDPTGFENSVLELTSVFQQEGKAASFYEALDDVALKNPDKAVIYFVQSLLSVQMKKNDLAETKIQQALKLQPDWDKALIFQAQIAVFSGDLEKAKTLLKNDAARLPNNSKIKKMLAQVLIKTASYEEAVGVYQDIIKAEPADVESQFALALVYMQLEQVGKAEDIFKKLTEQAQWQSQASFYLGKIEEKRDNLKKALTWFDKVKDGAFMFDASMSSISLLAKDKQFDEANARISLLPAQFPKQKLRIVLIQVEVLNLQKQYEKAYQLLSDELAKEPEQKELLYTRALMAERIDKLDIVEADLKKILAKYPDDAEALNALGYTLLDRTNRYSEAEKYLLKALQLQPDEAVIMDSYGWLQFKLGNKLQALEYLQKAYAKQPESEIAGHLAEVLWVLDRKEEAKKIFDKAIKDAPEDEYLLDFQQRILDGAK